MYAGTESVAYDYARFDNRSRVRKAAELTALEASPKKKKKRAFAINWRAVFFLFAMAGVCGFIVYNYMKVTMLSAQIAEQKAVLETYRDEETQLRAQQDQLYDLSEVAQVAQNRLNMVQLEKSQIEYVQLPNPDKVEMAAAAEEKSSDFLAGLAKSFNAVVEYLS